MLHESNRQQSLCHLHHIPYRQNFWKLFNGCSFIDSSTSILSYFLFIKRCHTPWLIMYVNGAKLYFFSTALLVFKGLTRAMCVSLKKNTVSKDVKCFMSMLNLEWFIKIQGQNCAAADFSLTMNIFERWLWALEAQVCSFFNTKILFQYQFNMQV